MGASPYCYIVEYDSDVERALQKLREREFQAGRYYPAMMLSEYRPQNDLLGAGPSHASIEDAREAAQEDGTQSILDLDHVSTVPETCAISPLDDEVLLELYGTTTPTRDMVEFDYGWCDYTDRAQGLYIVLYEHERPTEIFIGGYTFD